jgi:hypothetical protein
MMAHLLSRKGAVSDRFFTGNLSRPALGDRRSFILPSPGREEFFSYDYFTYPSAVGRWQAPGRFGEESGE